MPVPTMSHLDYPEESVSTVQLHRCRFFDHTPSPITALAFSPTPLPRASDPAAAKGKAKEQDLGSSSSNELGVLVVARENGCVEVWEWVAPEDTGMGNWVLERVLPPTLTYPSISLMAFALRDPPFAGSRPYRIPKVVDLRLYTSGSDSGDILERCLITGRILQIYSVPAPPVWSMSVSPTHELLCVASTSPNLHFLAITPGGLESPPSHLLRTDALPSKTRTVSLAWGPPKGAQTETDWEWRDTYVISGNSDSSFRHWELPDPRAGQPSVGAGRVMMKRRAVVEKINRNQKKAYAKGSIVWGVAVLPDHTIVTSDSLGSVTFWDGAALAQKATFRAHKADGMVLIPGPQGKTVFSAGPDQRVCQFTYIADQWQLTATKRLHSHDIRALATFPAYTPMPTSFLSYTHPNPDLAPVLASGGWDMNLVLTPCASPEVLSNRLRNPLSRNKGLSRIVFEEAYSRKMSYLGGGRSTGQISISRESRLVVGRKERSVGMWRVLEDELGWEKVLEMDLRLRTTLTASAVSANGEWLAVSDLYETKVFHLESTTPGMGDIRPERVKSFLPTLHASSKTSHLNLESSGTGSSSLVFTLDSSRLIMGLTISGQVVVIHLTQDRMAEVEVEQCFSRTESATPGRAIQSPAKHHAKTNVRKLDRPNGTGALVNGVAGEGRSDEEMEEEEEDDDDASDEEAVQSSGVEGKDLARVACLAVSGDGQWLAVSDLSGKVSLFNLDTLRPYSILPTLPVAPVDLLFPSTHPSLLTIISPNQTIQFYHIEQRRLCSPTQQINTLNRALRDQFLPVQSATFEPSRDDSKNAKIVIWSSDWICSARLDLDLICRTKESKKSERSLARSLRRKRAEEAREQLERSTASSPSASTATPTTPAPLSTAGSVGQGSPQSRQISNDSKGKVMSSAEDPEFFKIVHDRFRSVAGVDWLGEGELCVVERPMGDFVGELPAAFWSGSFGRS